MNKICTSQKQSQKLIELGIDINTADMRYGYIAHYEKKSLRNYRILLANGLIKNCSI